jgi:hypothetical protein
MLNSTKMFISGTMLVAIALFLLTLVDSFKIEMVPIWISLSLLTIGCLLLLGASIRRSITKKDNIE